MSINCFFSSRFTNFALKLFSKILFDSNVNFSLKFDFLGHPNELVKLVELA